MQKSFAQITLVAILPDGDYMIEPGQYDRRGNWPPTYITVRRGRIKHEWTFRLHEGRFGHPEIIKTYRDGESRKYPKRLRKAVDLVAGWKFMSTIK